MNSGELLSLAKYLSFAVTAASSSWGLLKETSAKDATGKKQLTRAGQVAIALAFGSALLGVLSFGLESLVKEQARVEERANAEAAKSAAKLADVVREQRDEARAERLEVQTQRLARETELNAEVRAQTSALRQLEQNQKLLLASQPLRSIDFSLALGSLDSRLMKVVRQGKRDVEGFFESDDNLKFLDSAARFDLTNALTRIHVLFPLLRAMAGAQDDADVSLLIDLDGAGSVLIPIGYVKGTESAGYVDNSTALGLQLNIPDDSEESNKKFEAANPLPYDCDRLRVSMNERTRSLTIEGKVPSHCLSRVVHRPTDGAVTAAIARGGKLILLVGGKNGLPIQAKNATVRRSPIDLCWNAGAKQSRHISYRIKMTPNAIDEMSSVRQRRSRKAVDVRHGGGAESEPVDYGRCIAFSP